MNKSGACFDVEKLKFINGHHLRHLSKDKLHPLLAAYWVDTGLLKQHDTPFVHAAIELFRDGLVLVNDAGPALQSILPYPFKETLETEAGQGWVKDNLKEFADAIVEVNLVCKFQPTTVEFRPCSNLSKIGTRLTVFNLDSEFLVGCCTWSSAVLVAADLGMHPNGADEGRNVLICCPRRPLLACRQRTLERCAARSQAARTRIWSGVRGVGKKFGRKGKRLWMPLRLCLTGKLEGPELDLLLPCLQLEDEDVQGQQDYVNLAGRIEVLREWSASQS